MIILSSCAVTSLISFLSLILLDIIDVFAHFFFLCWLFILVVQSDAFEKLSLSSSSSNLINDSLWSAKYSSSVGNSFAPSNTLHWLMLRDIDFSLGCIPFALLDFFTCIYKCLLSAVVKFVLFFYNACLNMSSYFGPFFLRFINFNRQKRLAYTLKSNPVLNCFTSNDLSTAFYRTNSWCVNKPV